MFRDIMRTLRDVFTLSFTFAVGYLSGMLVGLALVFMVLYGLAHLIMWVL